MATSIEQAVPGFPGRQALQSTQDYEVILAPREGVNDDVVQVSEWLVPDGAEVRQNQPLVTLETTKATFDLQAPRNGYLFHLVAAGAEVPVGSALALVSEYSTRPAYSSVRESPAVAQDGEPLVTKKAKELMEQCGLTLRDFAGLAVVRSEDVEAMVQSRNRPSDAAAAPLFRGERLNPAADWDAPRQTELYRHLNDLLVALRRRMKARFNRHVSTNNLLNDRWDLAKDYGFGEGTSVYDDCLILGDVQVGQHCWIGPFTVLDGTGQLKIGDYVDVGAGTQIYTHNSIDRALTGHQAPLLRKQTTIGNCCFVAPGSVIAPGTVIGDHCFVATGSYVEGVFAPYSFISGNPARVVGSVELQDGRARIRVAPQEPRT